MPANLPLPLDEWLPLRPCGPPAPAPGFTAELTLQPGSPWLDGHFPDRPILPGVALLALVGEAARQWLGPIEPRGFRSVRFKQFVVPGTTLRVALAAEEARPDDAAGPRVVRFSVATAPAADGSGGELVCQGALLAGPTARP